jgi:hypothetical protein
MHSAGARALREDENEMSREAVLLQWERKIEAAERLEEAPAEAPEPDYTQAPRPRRFARLDPVPSQEEPEPPAEPEPLAERRTITITGQPTPARRRRSPVVDAQLAQPDRIALWAFLLGLLLVAVAAGTAHV